MQVRPIEGASFGVEVEGLDVAPGVTDEEMRALVDALHTHRLVVLRDQALREEEYLAFGRRWGTPIPHVLDHLRMPGHPEMMAIGNTGERRDDDAVRNGAAFWHTDQSYEAEPSTATMLYSVLAPEVGGETQICDLVGAWEALDEDTKARVRDLVALHLYGAASGRDGEGVAAPLVNEAQRARVPPVRHPLVRAHPVTGRPSLYAVAGTPFAIEGMGEKEGAELLRRLKAHALQERFIYRHHYRVGDIAIYDTTATLHSGTPIGPATCERDARLLWRISVRGRPDVCA